MTLPSLPPDNQPAVPKQQYPAVKLPIPQLPANHLPPANHQLPSARVPGEAQLPSIMPLSRAHFANMNGKLSRAALWSLILGIAAWIFLPYWAAVAAIVLGHIALNAIKHGLGAGKKCAIAGLILGYGQFLTLGVLIWILSPEDATEWSFKLAVVAYLF